MSPARRDDRPLRGRTNIGPTIAARLAAADVKTVGDLTAIGPAEAYRRVRRRYPARTVPVCYYLYALQGALDGVPWDALSPAVKKRLRERAGAERPAWRASRRARAGG